MGCDGIIALKCPFGLICLDLVLKEWAARYCHLASMPTISVDLLKMNMPTPTHRKLLNKMKENDVSEVSRNAISKGRISWFLCLGRASVNIDCLCYASEG